MKGSLVKKEKTLKRPRSRAMIKAVFFIVDFSDSVKIVDLCSDSSGILPKTLEM
jgi:hypothetical protein